jgi:hypothetical protein
MLIFDIKITMEIMLDNYSNANESLRELFFDYTPWISDDCINVSGLRFKFKNSKFILVTENLKTNEIIQTGKTILTAFNLVNKKGYVPKEDPNPIIPNLYSFLTKTLSIKIKEYGFGFNENTYSLWYNFLLINLLLLVSKELGKKTEITNSLISDQRTELKRLRNDLVSRLDPYLRMQVQKRGITIIQNTYTGFDTEYELIDYNKSLNKLISIQLAMKTRTMVKIPLYSCKDISFVHALTSEITTYFKPKIVDWNVDVDVVADKKDISNTEESLTEMNILNDSLKECVVQIRHVCFKSHDLLSNEIINVLKEQGLFSFEDTKKDQIVFCFATTPLKTKILYPGGNITLNDLVNISNKESDDLYDSGFCSVLDLFNSSSQKFDSKNILRWYSKTKNKARIRTTVTFDSGVCVSLTLITNNYFCAHYNSADFSLLADFESLKTKLDIVNKSFVTISRPLKFESSNVYVRDTILLAPAGLSSLKALGNLHSNQDDYEKIGKIEVSSEDLQQMSAFLKRDKKKFELYAIQDAVITLKHSLFMEEFNFNIKQLGVPLTLSSLGRNFVLDQWTQNFVKHTPYQITGNCLIGNTDEVQTPKGLFYTGAVGLHMSYYIGNYKGGRNESFMYGTDEKTDWFDYDLVSAYTTAMSHLSFPSYGGGVLVNPVEVMNWTKEQLLKGYLIVNGMFEFPSTVKYPSIPCYIDKTSTVYPQTGGCLLTGPEYLLAKNQGCKINILSAFYIPPKEKQVSIHGVKTTTTLKPFFEIINKIQDKRREYPKGHILNLLYKEMGNSIYGNVVRGISNKKGFDTKSGKLIRVPASEISNPILASWTTAFIRSVIGECLHNISKLGGKVVSVTTDGFITDLKDLEGRLLTLPESEIPLFLLYRELRYNLSSVKEALEVKSSGSGIISWTTRGQLGMGSKIKATTGFQSKGYEHKELVSFFKDCMQKEDKFFDYTQQSLRGAKDIWQKGGHVTRKFRDQVFRLYYDNRRQIVETEDFKDHDMSNKLFDSRPLHSKSDCIRLRFLSKLPFNLPYQRNSSKSKNTSYKSYLNIAIRNFIKGYLAKEPRFGLKGTEIKSYKDIMSFISGFEPAKDVKLSKQSISNLKHRRMVFKPVIKTKDTLTFANFVKEKIPDFSLELFFKP